MMIARGLVAGAALGLAEVALTYATGVIPRTDAPRVFLFDVALGTALGIVAAAMLRLAPGSGALRSTALWTLRAFAPVLILVRGILVRGAPPSATTLVAAPSAVAAGALIAALASLYALRSARHGRDTLARSVASAAVCAALAGVCAVLLGTTPCRTPPQGAAAAANPARPNVLLVVLDTVRRDHLSAYGYERRTTPSIDALAQRAHLFVNAYATSPYTLSSHASLFTGLLPSEHGAHPVSHRSQSGSPLQVISGGYYPLGPEAPTLADRLRTRGYQTAAIAANHVFFSAWSGLARGFECLTTVQRHYRYYPLVHAAARADKVLFNAYLSPFLRADHVTDAAMGWIGSIGEQPFFLFLNYFDAHEPYAPPRPYDRLFQTGRPRSGVRDRWHEKRHFGRLDEDDLEYLLSQYDGEIAYVDSQLGRLLDWLERASLLDRTLVLVTSDHGEYFGEHGMYGHGKALYEEALRVPLIVKLPGQRTGTRIERLLGLHDVASIVEGAVGGAPDPLALAHAGTGPRVLAEYWLPQLLVRARPDLFKAGYVRAAYDGRYKLIQADTGGDELYDLSEDKGEARNLLALEPERAAPLRTRIVAAAPPLVDVTSTKRVAPRLNPETLEQLRALGYMD